MEYGFDTLPGGPSWDAVATNAFNLFVERWNADADTCNGGLKWQYDPKANGWTVSSLPIRFISRNVFSDSRPIVVQERCDERRYVPDSGSTSPLHGKPDVRRLGH